MHVGLGEDQCTGCTQATHRERLTAEIGQSGTGAGCGRHAGHVEKILDGDRHSVQGAQGCTGTPSFIERISVARSRIEINPGDRIQAAMAFVSGTRLLK